MRQAKYLIFAAYFSVLAISCDLANSQVINSNNQNVNLGGDGAIVLKNPSPGLPDDYEIAKDGAERLNNKSVERIGADEKIKPLTRRQIRDALSRSNLVGESKDGKVGGGKIVHFSHTCDLLVEGKLFRVVRVPIIIQLASFSRRFNHTLIYDDSMHLIHDITVDGAPLFCDGNRLFFDNYDMAFTYGEAAEEVKGNVFIFTNGARNIEGVVASLNFYKFRDLIY